MRLLKPTTSVWMDWVRTTALTVGPTIALLLTTSATGRALTWWFWAAAATTLLWLTLWPRWLRRHDHYPWILRCGSAGKTLGACFGSLLLPIFGTLIGALVGLMVGLLLAGPHAMVTGIRGRDRKGDGPIHRRSQAFWVALVAGFDLLMYLGWRGDFDDPSTKYLSVGELRLQFVTRVLVPSAFTIAYVVLASRPSVEHPLIGEGSRTRRAATALVLAGLFVSSLMIGAHWALDNFPHPD